MVNLLGMPGFARWNPVACQAIHQPTLRILTPMQLKLSTEIRYVRSYDAKPLAIVAIAEDGFTRTAINTPKVSRTGSLWFIHLVPQEIITRS
jgi:hypothetical protein